MNELIESFSLKKAIIIYFITGLIAFLIEIIFVLSGVYYIFVLTLLDFIGNLLLIYLILRLFKRNHIDYKKGIKETFFSLQPIPTILFIFLGISSLYLGAQFFLHSSSVTDLSTITSGDISYSPSQLDLGLAFVFTLFSASFCAPLIEEFGYRGLLLTKLQRKTNVTSSIILGSLVFALIHPATNMVGAFIIGLSLSIVYLKTNNLYYTMILHFFINFTSMVLIQPLTSIIIVPTNYLSIFWFVILITSLLILIKKYQFFDLKNNTQKSY